MTKERHWGTDELDGYSYEPETGLLFSPLGELSTWVEHSGRYMASRIYVPHGGHNGYRQSTHVIFKIMTGCWPQPGKWIDHIDGNQRNNRWDNLREVTPAQNAHNGNNGTTRLNGVNENLERGVWKRPNGTYCVKIQYSHWGTFKTAAEANARALEIRRELYGEFDVSNQPPMPPSLGVTIADLLSEATAKQLEPCIIVRRR